MTADALFTWEEAMDEAGGIPIFPQNSAVNSGFSAVSIDSRDVKKGALFTALKGEKVDGHNFIKNAIENGAAGALVSSNYEKLNDVLQYAIKNNAAILIVDNTLLAMQKLAAAHIRKFKNIVRIGITGSSGKTTTKEIASRIIRNEKKVIYNEGNLNSDIGLPLSVFNVRREHEVCVFEMGMNRVGEIAELAEILKPQIALITNIGSAHVGIIGSEEKIAKEKKDIFSFFSGNEMALIPEDCVYADFLKKDIKGNVALFSEKLVGIEEVVDCGLEGFKFMFHGQKAVFPLPGTHNLQNAAAAIAIAQSASIGRDAIIEGLQDCAALHGRSEIIKKEIAGKKITIFQDCYNANPDSFEKALSFFENVVWDGRKIIVAGEMFELGDESRAAHKNLFSHIDELKAENKYFYSPSNKNYEAKNIKIFYDIEKLKKEIINGIKENDFIFVKGSRVCELERIFL